MRFTHDTVAAVAVREVGGKSAPAKQCLDPIRPLVRRVWGLVVAFATNDILSSWCLVKIATNDSLSSASLG